jgi:type IV pilus assembly protein PilC
MPRYHYQALNADQQLVVGEVEADTAALALAQIEALGLTVQAIGIAGSEIEGALTLREVAATPPGPMPPIDDERQTEIALQSHLARTFERGRPLVPALRAYAEEMPSGRRRRELLEVCRVLENGNVAEAMSGLTSSPDYWIALVGSASGSNPPDKILQSFIVDSQQADETRRQWWTLLAYPLFLVAFASAVLAVLAYMVVPTFQSIFDDFDLQLPWITVWTLNVSHWITSGAALVGLLSLIAIAGLTVAISGHALGYLYAELFGRSAAIARFVGFTADLLEGGIAVPDAVRIAGRTATGGRLRNASQAFAPQLEADNVGAAQRSQRPLTATFVYAVTADMPIGARIRLLQEIAACYADRARSRMLWTQGIVGPMTMLIVGFLVGFVAFSLFIPLINLVNNLSG